MGAAMISKIKEKVLKAWKRGKVVLSGDERLNIIRERLKM
jgi:hypothetical protein